ncbi:Uncharacterized protein TCM_009807 [Theobroma cacao]|uniref:Uncharacterized protein n=1 Tax=Theobroma cacao TaxID=3641 RepID=A0A061E5A6_THECC|nr:Uncharacterized protein TCM_009807 [Theobroma cacao]
MAPKKRTCSSGTRFGRSKFVSTNVAKRHTQSLVHKAPILECGIDLHPKLYSSVHKVTIECQWEQFCKQLEAAVLPTV